MNNAIISISIIKIFNCFIKKKLIIEPIKQLIAFKKYKVSCFSRFPSFFIF